MSSSPNSSLTRRGFVARGTLALGAAAIAPQILSSRVLGAPGLPGAKDRLTLGFIGVGGMGGGHLRHMVSRGDANIAAVCDVDETHLAKAMEVAGPQATPYRDYRYLLERKDIDAVIIATPDHWHAVQMVHACESGKHVYVEKPACATIAEGKGWSPRPSGTTGACKSDPRGAPRAPPTLPTGTSPMACWGG